MSGRRTDRRALAQKARRPPPLWNRPLWHRPASCPRLALWPASSATHRPPGGGQVEAASSTRTENRAKVVLRGEISYTSAPETDDRTMSRRAVHSCIPTPRPAGRLRKAKRQPRSQRSGRTVASAHRPPSRSGACAPDRPLFAIRGLSLVAAPRNVITAQALVDPDAVPKAPGRPRGRWTIVLRCRCLLCARRDFGRPCCAHPGPSGSTSTGARASAAGRANGVRSSPRQAASTSARQRPHSARPARQGQKTGAAPCGAGLCAGVMC